MTRSKCFIFLARWIGTFKNGKCQLLKIAESRYTVILIKIKKRLELVSSLQHGAKNMVEMFVLKYTSIWPVLFW